jgi:integrase/recombinase XerD
MLNSYILNSRRCERYYQSNAGPHLNHFIGWLMDQGFQHQTIRRRIRGAVEFAQWSGSCGIGINKMDLVALNDYGKSLAEVGELRSTCGDYRQDFLGARSFLRFLGDSGLSHFSMSEISPDYPDLYNEFTSWMFTHRGVAESTLDSYRAIILDLLKKMGDQPQKYTSKGLREFVLYRVQRHNKSSAQNVISAMRMFLRYLTTVGHVEPTLAGSIPNIAAWQLQHLPRCLSVNVVDKVIAGCDENTLLGARNRAVFLLLAQLGLRAGEVAAMSFSDIDWENATLKIRDKCRRESRLPIPQVVGDALLHYIEKFRPHVAIEQVFISTVAPHRALRRVSISQLATQALKRAGEVSPKLGAHMFRHTMATTLLNEGLSLQTIAIVLRHSSLESTRIYTHVDQELMHEVCLPWSGVTLC